MQLANWRKHSCSPRGLVESREMAWRRSSLRGFAAQVFDPGLEKAEGISKFLRGRPKRSMNIAGCEAVDR